MGVLSGKLLSPKISHLLLFYSPKKHFCLLQKSYYNYFCPKISQANYIRNQMQKEDNNFQFAKHVLDIALSIFNCYNTKLLNRTH